MKMTNRVKGKIALVTGAASRPGIGYSCAERLAKEGATVYLTDINKEGLDKAVKKINLAGGNAIGVIHDVASEGDWDTVFNQIKKDHGRIDILINNAGIAMLGTLDELTPAAYHKQIDINMNSVYYGTQRAVSLMREIGEGGAIVSMSSIVGLKGFAGCYAYAASKGGVRLMQKTAALETAKDNIRINTVHPGMIDTNIQNDAKRDNAEFYDAVAASVPMGRFGTADEVANLVLFLASDEAVYITGGEFVIDGGMTA